MATCTVFELSAVNYQTVCNDLYIGSVQTNNCFYRRHNTANARRLQLVTRLFTANSNFGSIYLMEFLALCKQPLYVIGRCSLRSVSYFILPAHQRVELLHTVYSDRLWTEWKYKCKCTVTATVRCSYNCTDSALGEFFDRQCGLQLDKHFPIVRNET